MPSFYERSCINGSIFLLSCKCIQQKEENQRYSTEWESYQMLPTRREIKCSLCLLLLKKQYELCHHSGTLNSKAQGPWDNLRARFTGRVPAAQHQPLSSTAHLLCAPSEYVCGPHPRWELLVVLCQGDYLWRKITSKLCKDSSTKS